MDVLHGRRRTFQKFKVLELIARVPYQYGHFESLGDMLRQIGVDERQHKNESLVRIARARFS